MQRIQLWLNRARSETLCGVKRDRHGVKASFKLPQRWAATGKSRLELSMASVYREFAGNQGCARAVPYPPVHFAALQVKVGNRFPARSFQTFVLPLPSPLFRCRDLGGATAGTVIVRNFTPAQPNGGSLSGNAKVALTGPCRPATTVKAHTLWIFKKVPSYWSSTNGSQALT